MRAKACASDSLPVKEIGECRATCGTYIDALAMGFGDHSPHDFFFLRARMVSHRKRRPGVCFVSLEQHCVCFEQCGEERGLHGVLVSRDVCAVRP